ncbi:MAG: hypothetical protein NE328_03860 [Lentisphaeraceae bacterium]|nr:hypothetical protein [Lentisphaeraceae bacterium]
MSNDENSFGVHGSNSNFESIPLSGSVLSESTITEEHYQAAIGKAHLEGEKEEREKYELEKSELVEERDLLKDKLREIEGKSKIEKIFGSTEWFRLSIVSLVLIVSLIALVCLWQAEIIRAALWTMVTACLGFIVGDRLS